MTKPTGKPRGRPETLEDSQDFTFRLPLALLNQIKADAARQNLSVSEWLRRAAVRELERGES